MKSTLRDKKKVENIFKESPVDKNSPTYKINKSGLIIQRSENIFDLECAFKLQCARDFPGSPVVENLPSSAGDSGSISGRETKITHATGQLSLPPQLLSPHASVETQRSQKINKRKRKRKNIKLPAIQKNKNFNYNVHFV